MVRRAEERLQGYPISLLPSMLAEVKREAARDGVSTRLWIRTAIANRLKVRKKIRQEEHDKRIADELARARALAAAEQPANEAQEDVA
jgi:hypothetical protein